MWPRTLALPMSVSCRRIPPRRSFPLGIPTNPVSCGVWHSAVAEPWQSSKRAARWESTPPRAGPDDPQVGQRTPPVCQGQTGKASGLDAPAHRGGPVGGADAVDGPAAWREPRAHDARRRHHAEDDARGSQAAGAADRAVDHHRGGGQGQNRACWCDTGACDRPQQDGKAGGVWPAISAQSPWGWLCLWDITPRGSGRVEDALAGAGGVPRNLWGARHTHVGGLRPGRLCLGHYQGARQRGGQGDWPPAQRPRGVARCRGRPRDGQERARQDRRDHWYPEDRQVWVQQTHGTPLAHAGDGRPAVYPLVQSEQVDAGPGTGRQVRRKGIGADRTEKTTPGERQEGGQEASVTLKVVLRHALYIRQPTQGEISRAPVHHAIAYR